MLKVPCLSLNKRKLRKWIRNTEINYEKVFVLTFVGIMLYALVIGVMTLVEINTYNNIQCPTIRRVLTPEVKAETLNRVTAEVSSFTASQDETDNTPCITADGTNICGANENIVANNCLKFGTKVEIDGIVYRVADRMNARYGCNHYDILKNNKTEAINFGRQIKEVIIYR